MLAIGATVLVAGQAVVNIAMVTGVIPVIGVPLPFISFGGTSLVVNMLAVGLLISVGRRGKAADIPGGRVRTDEALTQRKTRLRSRTAAGKYTTI